MLLSSEMNVQCFSMYTVCISILTKEERRPKVTEMIFKIIFYSCNTLHVLKSRLRMQRYF